MNFAIAPEIFAKYPDYICGVVIATGINNKGESEEIMKTIKATEEKVKSEFDLSDLANHPFIQNWRRVYSSFGGRPAEFRASSEALIRRALKGNPVSHISKLVDIYNYLSLKYKTPVGGEDVDKIVGNLTLKFAKGTETFIPLGKQENDPPEAGEVVYVDDSENVLCRKWNWRESDVTKLTEETKNAIIVIEAMPPVAESDVKSALDELSNLLQKFCNARMQSFVMNKSQREIEF